MTESIIHTLMAMSDLNEPRLRGQLARLRGEDRYYGCHFGMRSTRDYWQRQFYAGWDEIDQALQGHTARNPELVKKFRDLIDAEIAGPRDGEDVVEAAVQAVRDSIQDAYNDMPESQLTVFKWLSILLVRGEDAR